MTITQDNIDLTWELFTEDDVPEACMSDCGNKAVGALYVPMCGRHPMCRPCINKWKKLARKVGNSSPVYVWCTVHHVKAEYPRNPVIVEG